MTRIPSWLLSCFGLRRVLVVLVEVHLATLAGYMRVVSRSADGDRFEGTSEEVAELVCL